jgi:hypothetical protein
MNPIGTSEILIFANLAAANQWAQTYPTRAVPGRIIRCSDEGMAYQRTATGWQTLGGSARSDFRPAPPGVAFSLTNGSNGANTVITGPDSATITTTATNLRLFDARYDRSPAGPMGNIIPPGSRFLLEFDYTSSSLLFPSVQWLSSLRTNPTAAPGGNTINQANLASSGTMTFVWNSTPPNYGGGETLSIPLTRNNAPDTAGITFNISNLRMLWAPPQT